MQSPKRAKMQSSYTGGPMVVFTDVECDDFSALIVLCQLAAKYNSEITLVITRRKSNVLKKIASNVAGSLEFLGFKNLRVLYDYGDSDLEVSDEYVMGSVYESPVEELKFDDTDSMHRQLNIKDRTVAPTYVVIDVPYTFMKAVRAGLWISDSNIWTYGSFNYRQMTSDQRSELLQIFSKCKNVFVFECYQMFSGGNNSLNKTSAPEFYAALESANDLSRDATGNAYAYMLGQVASTWNRCVAEDCADTMFSILGPSVWTENEWRVINKKYVMEEAEKLASTDASTSARLKRNLQAYKNTVSEPYQMLAADGVVALSMASLLPNLELKPSRLSFNEIGYSQFTSEDSESNLFYAFFPNGINDVIPAFTQLVTSKL
jgi:hypothetical protein